MQNKTNKVAQNNKGEQTMKKQTVEQPVRLDDKVVTLINQAKQSDKLISTQQNTGHIAIKYGNKVLFEYHAKKRSIGHLTFSQKDKVFKILETKKLITRVVPKSYGWRMDTECLLTPELAKELPAIIKCLIDEAIERRNLKEAPKKAEKKVANK